MEKEKMVLDREDLSVLLKRSVVTIRNQIYRAPEKLPPFVKGSAPRVWYLPAVQAWLLDKSSGPIEAPVVEIIQPSGRGRGRPRNQANSVGGAK